MVKSNDMPVDVSQYGDQFARDLNVQDISFYNNVDSDADGARDTSLLFHGETAAAATHALGKISFVHDGSAADEKGRVILSLNTGSEGLSPSSFLSIDNSSGITLNGSNPVLAAEDADGSLSFANGNSGTTAVTIYGTSHGSKADEIDLMANSVNVVGDLNVTGSHNLTLGGGVGQDPYMLTNQGADEQTDTGYVIQRYKDDVAEDTASVSDTAQAGATSTITLHSGASATDDAYNNWVIKITGGTGNGQIRVISDYVGSTKVATVDSDWTTAPDNTSTFSLFEQRYVGLFYDESVDKFTLGSASDVSGTSITFVDNLPLVAGSLDLDDTLTVAGAATFTTESVHNGGIDVNGNADVSGTLDVSGLTTLTTRLQINGSAPAISGSALGSDLEIYCNGTDDTNGPKLRLYSSGGVGGWYTGLFFDDDLTTEFKWDRVRHHERTVEFAKTGTSKIQMDDALTGTTDQLNFQNDDASAYITLTGSGHTATSEVLVDGVTTRIKTSGTDKVVIDSACAIGSSSTVVDTTITGDLVVNQDGTTTNIFKVDGTNNTITATGATTFSVESIHDGGIDVNGDANVSGVLTVADPGYITSGHVTGGSLTLRPHNSATSGIRLLLDNTGTDSMEVYQNTTLISKHTISTFDLGTTSNVVDTNVYGDLLVNNGATNVLNLDVSAGTLTTTTNSTFSGTLGVTGAATFTAESVHNGGIDVNGNADVSGTLGVTGAATFTAESVHNGGIDVNGNADVSGNLVVGGNFTVSGTTTTVESTTVKIEDNILQLNSGPSVTKDGGIIFQRYIDDVVADADPGYSGQTAQSGSASTITLSAGQQSLDNYFSGWVVAITSGTGSGQERVITNYVGSTKVATVSPDWTTAPDNTSVHDLHQRTHVGLIFDESASTFRLQYVPFTHSFDEIDFLLTDRAPLSVGAITTDADLTCSSGATFTNETVHDGGIDVNGNADVSGTLGVTGISTFTAQSVHNGGIDVNGNADVSGTLGVTGAATFTAESVHNGGIDVNGNADVSGTLDVTGLTTLTTRLQINGGTPAISGSGLGSDLDIYCNGTNAANGPKLRLYSSGGLGGWYTGLFFDDDLTTEFKWDRVRHHEKTVEFVNSGTSKLQLDDALTGSTDQLNIQNDDASAFLSVMGSGHTSASEVHVDATLTRIKSSGSDMLTVGSSVELLSGTVKMTAANPFLQGEDTDGKFILRNRENTETYYPQIQLVGNTAASDPGTIILNASNNVSKDGASMILFSADMSGSYSSRAEIRTERFIISDHDASPMDYFVLETTSNDAGTCAIGSSVTVVDTTITGDLVVNQDDTTTNIFKVDGTNNTITATGATTFTAESVHNGGIDVNGDADVSGVLTVANPGHITSGHATEGSLTLRPHNSATSGIRLLLENTGTDRMEVYKNTTLLTQLTESSLGIGSSTRVIDTTMTGDLVVNQDGTTTNIFKVDGTNNTITATGVSTFTAESVHNGGIDVNGNADVSGTLDVTGTSTFTTESVHNGGIDVNGNADVSGTLDVTGTSTFTAESVHNGGIDVNGNANVSGVLTVADPGHITSGHATEGSLTLRPHSGTTSGIRLVLENTGTDRMEVYQNTTLLTQLTSSAFDIGTTTNGVDTTIIGDLVVNQDGTTTNLFKVDATADTVTVAAPTTISDDLTVTGSLTHITNELKISTSPRITSNYGSNISIYPDSSDAANGPKMTIQSSGGLGAWNVGMYFSDDLTTKFMWDRVEHHEKTVQFMNSGTSKLQLDDALTGTGDQLRIKNDDGSAMIDINGSGFTGRAGEIDFTGNSFNFDAALQFTQSGTSTLRLDSSLTGTADQLTLQNDDGSVAIHLYGSGHSGGAEEMHFTASSFNFDDVLQFTSANSSILRLDSSLTSGNAKLTLQNDDGSAAIELHGSGHSGGAGEVNFTANSFNFDGPLATDDEDRYFGVTTRHMVIHKDPTTAQDCGYWIEREPNEIVNLGTPFSTGDTAQAGTANTITLKSGAPITTNIYHGYIVEITSGTGSGQVKKIIAYDGSTKVATVASNWTTNPDNTSVYSLHHRNFVGLMYDTGEGRFRLVSYGREDTPYNTIAVSAIGLNVGEFKATGTAAFIDDVEVNDSLYFDRSNTTDPDGTIYFGSETTDGSIRIDVDDTGIKFQRRESGSWVTKNSWSL